jgi:prepilin-type N-terminal cleavage/methylation domain-containing protein/prepilin-type processing-associated H-X9-DG protein
VKRPGFSLIELLVVIGIMGILIGIVLPIATRSFAKGREAQCASQLRQLALGAFAYASDHRGYMPPRGAASWPGMTNVNPTFADFVGPYLQMAAANKPTVWRCPDDKRPGIVSSYGVNRMAYLYAMTDLNAQSGWPLLMVQKPSTVVLLADSGGSPNAVWDVSFDGAQPIREQNVEFRHGRARDNAASPAASPAVFRQSRANYVFCDGHVEALEVNSLSSTNWVGQP